MASTIENFIVKITTQGAEKLDQISRSADSLNSKMGVLSGTLLGVSFGAFLKGAIEAADKISDLSDATGISIESLKSFESALEIGGGKSKNLERAINGLLTSIESANDGSLKTRDAFNEVGVSLSDLKNLSEQSILDKTISGLAQLKEEGRSASEVASIGTTLMSRAFRGVDVQGFFQAYREGKITFKEAVASIEANAAANAKLEETYRKLQSGAQQALLPIAEAIKDLGITTEGATKFIVGLGVAIGLALGVQAATTIVGSCMAIAKGIYAIGTAAGFVGKNPIIKLVAGLAVGVLGAAGAWVAYDSAIGKVEEAQAKLNKELSNTTPQIDTGDANRKQELDARQKAAIEARKRIAQIEIETNRLRLDITNGALDQIAQIETQKTADIAKSKQEIYSRENVSRLLMDEEYSAKRLEIEKRAELEIAKLRGDAVRQAAEQAGSIGLRTRELSWQLDLEKQMIGLSQGQRDIKQSTFDIEKQRAAALEQMYRIQNLEPGKREFFIQQINNMYDAQARLKGQIYEVQNSFEAGWGRAFASYMDNATNAAKMAENIFNAMTGNLNRAIDDFVDNGKFSFKDFTNSVLRDMAKIQMKAAAANILSAGGSLLSGLFSGRAIGGPVQANEPYVVGERGPELFVPATAGNIVPNNNMSSGTGGSTIVQYNISAVDALSFKQMIARDPTFLYAVAEQGRKSLPLTRR